MVYGFLFHTLSAEYSRRHDAFAPLHAEMPAVISKISAALRRHFIDIADGIFCRQALRRYATVLISRPLPSFRIAFYTLFHD